MSPAALRQAVILSGGRGSRLGQLTMQTPKPLLPVGGRPFLDHLLSWLARAGVSEVFLSTGYLAGSFSAFLEAGSRTGRWRGPSGEPITLIESCEESPLGTAGALTLLRGRLDPRFMLLNGDSYFACDAISILRAGEALPRGHALLTTRFTLDTARYGRCEIGPRGKITAFREKGLSGPGQINAGIAVLPSALLDQVTSLPASLESEIYPALVSKGLLHAHPAHGFFIDIGLPETYAEAQWQLRAALRRPAIFFDRDGVLNYDSGHTHRLEDLSVMPGAAEALALARQYGFQTVVVSNQSGIARGYYDESALQQFNAALNQALREKGGWVDAFYHCPYHSEASRREFRHDNHPERKPNPGMILRAAKEMEIDLTGSFLIGDQPSDLAAAKAAGLPGYLYQGGRLDDFLANLIDPLPRDHAPPSRRRQLQ